MTRALAFGLAFNIIIILTFGWLLKAYWPMDKPPSPWNMLLLMVFACGASIMALDMLYIFDAIGTELHSASRMLLLRGLLGWAGIYGMHWHIRRREPASTTDVS